MAKEKVKTQPLLQKKVSYKNCAKTNVPQVPSKTLDWWCLEDSDNDFPQEGRLHLKIQFIIMFFFPWLRLRSLPNISQNSYIFYFDYVIQLFLALCTYICWYHLFTLIIHILQHLFSQQSLFSMQLARDTNLFLLPTETDFYGFV